MTIQKEIELLNTTGDPTTIDRILDIYKLLILDSTQKTLEANLIYFAWVLKTAMNKRYWKSTADFLQSYKQKCT